MCKFFTICLLAIFSLISEIHSHSLKMKKAHLKARHSYMDEDTRNSDRVYPVSDDQVSFPSDLFPPWDDHPVHHATNPRKQKKHCSRKHISPFKKRKTMVSLDRKLPMSAVTNQDRFDHSLLNVSPRSRKPNYEDNRSKSHRYNANRRIPELKSRFDRDDVEPRYAHHWMEDDDFYAKRTSPKRIHEELRQEDPDETYRHNGKGIFEENNLYERNQDEPIVILDSNHVRPDEDEADRINFEYPSMGEISTDSYSGDYLGSLLPNPLYTSKPKVNDLISAIEETKNTFLPNDPTRYVLMDLISSLRPKQDFNTHFVPWYLKKKIGVSDPRDEPSPIELLSELNDKVKELQRQRKTENDVAPVVKSEKRANNPFQRGFQESKHKRPNFLNSNLHKKFTLERPEQVEEDNIISSGNTRATTEDYKLNAFPVFKTDEKVNGNTYSKTIESHDTLTSSPIDMKLANDISSGIHKRPSNSDLLARILSDIENGYSRQYLTPGNSTVHEESPIEGKFPELGYNAVTRHRPLETINPISKLGAEKPIHQKSSGELSPAFSREYPGQLEAHGIPPSEYGGRLRPLTNTNEDVKLSMNLTDYDGKAKEKGAPNQKDLVLMSGFVSLLKQKLADLDKEDGDTEDDAVIRYYERKLQLTAVFTFIIGLIILGILLMTLIFRLRAMDEKDKASLKKKTGHKKLVEMKRSSEKKMQGSAEKKLQTEGPKAYNIQQAQSMNGLCSLLTENSSFSENLPEKERSEELQMRLLGFMLSNEEETSNELSSAQESLFQGRTDTSYQGSQSVNQCK